MHEEKTAAAVSVISVLLLFTLSVWGNVHKRSVSRLQGAAALVISLKTQVQHFNLSLKSVTYFIEIIEYFKYFLMWTIIWPCLYDCP